MAERAHVVFFEVVNVFRRPNITRLLHTKALPTRGQRAENIKSERRHVIFTNFGSFGELSFREFKGTVA